MTNDKERQNNFWDTKQPQNDHNDAQLRQIDKMTQNNYRDTKCRDKKQLQKDMKWPQRETK